MHLHTATCDNLLSIRRIKGCVRVCFVQTVADFQSEIGLCPSLLVCSNSSRLSIRNRVVSRSVSMFKTVCRIIYLYQTITIPAVPRSHCEVANFRRIVSRIYSSRLWNGSLIVNFRHSFLIILWIKPTSCIINNQPCTPDTNCATNGQALHFRSRKTVHT